MRLRDFQSEGAKWLSERKVALLADDMGMGKTIQTIIACHLVNAKRVLVICPAVGQINWKREFDNFYPKLDLIILSYDKARTTKPTSLGHFDVLILDEVHYLKSLDAKRTRSIYGKQGFVRYAKRTWALSGTPAPNHAGELWTLLFTFSATTLSYEQFVTRYCEYYNGPRGRTITGTKKERINELRGVLSKVMLRRNADILKLEPIIYEDVVVPAGIVDCDVESSFIQYVFPVDRTNELEALLNRERQMIKDITDKEGYGNQAMKVLEAMAPSISTLRRYVGLQKVQACADIIVEELKNNAYEKIVIFAIHRDVIEALRLRMAGAIPGKSGRRDFNFNPVTLYGGTPAEKRQINIDKFQKNPKCRVFIGNIQAAGTSITLTSANQVFFVEQSFVPGDNAQAAKRCHRIGQTKPVFVRVAGLADSYDERMSQMLKRKMRDLTDIFDKPLE